MFQCVLCDKVYTQHRNLRRHVKLCHKTVGDIPSLKEEPVEWLQCSLCPEKYRNKRLLRRHHLKSHADVEEKREAPANSNSKNNCPLHCGFNSSDKNQFITHFEADHEI